MCFEFPMLGMQNTALSFTERSGHCCATSSDHWSWHPLPTSEGDKVIFYNVLRVQESWSNSTYVDVTLLMSFCWCHSANVHCEYHFVDVTLYKLINKVHFIDTTLKVSVYPFMSVGWCLFIEVMLLMSICCCHSINNKICEWTTIVILVWSNDWYI